MVVNTVNKFDEWLEAHRAETTRLDRATSLVNELEQAWRARDPGLYVARNTEPFLSARLVGLKATADHWLRSIEAFTDWVQADTRIREKAIQASVELKELDYKLSIDAPFVRGVGPNGEIGTPMDAELTRARFVIGHIWDVLEQAAYAWKPPAQRPRP